jgi:hypothetical protein
LRSFSPEYHASCDASADAHRGASRFRDQIILSHGQAGGGTPKRGVGRAAPTQPSGNIFGVKYPPLEPFREAQGTHIARGAVTDPPEGTLGRLCRAYRPAPSPAIAGYPPWGRLCIPWWSCCRGHALSATCRASRASLGVISLRDRWAERMLLLCVRDVGRLSTSAKALFDHLDAAGQKGRAAMTRCASASAQK